MAPAAYAYAWGMSTVFVLTLKDVVGLIMVGIALLILLIVFVWAKYEDWKWRRDQKRKGGKK